MGAPYFNRMTDADRAHPAVPDGGGARPAVAQGVGRAAAPPAAVAGVGGHARPWWSRAWPPGVRGLGAAAGLRPGRVRRRRRRAPAGAVGRPPARARRVAGHCWAGPTAAWSCTSAWCVVAVAFAASSSFGHEPPVPAGAGGVGHPGRPHRHLPGHPHRRAHPNKTTLVGPASGSTAARSTQPALHQFPFATQAIGTPSVRTGPGRGRVPHPRLAPRPPSPAARAAPCPTARTAPCPTAKASPARCPNGPAPP